MMQTGGVGRLGSELGSAGQRVRLQVCAPQTLAPVPPLPTIQVGLMAAPSAGEGP